MRRRRSLSSRLPPLDLPQSKLEILGNLKWKLAQIHHSLSKVSFLQATHSLEFKMPKHKDSGLLQILRWAIILSSWAMGWAILKILHKLLDLPNHRNKALFLHNKILSSQWVFRTTQKSLHLRYRIRVQLIHRLLWANRKLLNLLLRALSLLHFNQPYLKDPAFRARRWPF